MTPEQSPKKSPQGDEIQAGSPAGEELQLPQTDRERSFVERWLSLRVHSERLLEVGVLDEALEEGLLAIEIAVTHTPEGSDERIDSYNAAGEMCLYLQKHAQARELFTRATSEVAATTDPLHIVEALRGCVKVELLSGDTAAAEKALSYIDRVNEERKKDLAPESVAYLASKQLFLREWVNIVKRGEPATEKTLEAVMEIGRNAHIPAEIFVGQIFEIALEALAYAPFEPDDAEQRINSMREFLKDRPAGDGVLLANALNSFQIKVIDDYAKTWALEHALQLLDEAPEEQVNIEERAWMHHNLGALYGDRQDYSAALENLERGIMLLREAELAGTDGYATMMRSYGYYAGESGDTMAALKATRQACKYYEETGSTTKISYLRTLEELVVLYDTLGQLAPCSEALQKILVIADRFYAPDSPRLLSAKSKLANVYWGMDKFDECREVNDGLVQFYQANDDVDTDSYIDALLLSAHLARQRDDRDEMESALEAALPLIDALPRDEAWIYHMTQIGEFQLEDPDGLGETLSKIDVELAGMDPGEAEGPRALVARLHGTEAFMRGEYEEGIEHYRNAFKIVQEHWGTDGIPAANGIVDLASVLLRTTSVIPNEAYSREARFLLSRARVIIEDAGRGETQEMADVLELQVAAAEQLNLDAQELIQELEALREKLGLTEDQDD